MALQPALSLVLLSVKVSVITHTIRHTVGLLWTSDQPVAETSTCTGQHNRQTSMPSTEFEPAITANKRPETYALDLAATGIGSVKLYLPLLHLLKLLIHLISSK
jgi:hypothetical protein